MSREALRRSQERPTLRLFPELKRRNRARNEPSLIGPQEIGKAVWNTTRMLGVVFKVIQPDLEINRRHAATFLNPATGSSVRATSGSSVAGFGQILAAACGGNSQRVGRRYRGSRPKLLGQRGGRQRLHRWPRRHHEWEHGLIA